MSKVADSSNFSNFGGNKGGGKNSQKKSGNSSNSSSGSSSSSSKSSKSSSSSSSSKSSSSSSESCSTSCSKKSKCEDSCKSNKKHDLEFDLSKCDPVAAYKIYKKIANAVVRIQSQSILTTVAAPAIPTSEDSNTLTINGNGFFIRDHYIVCPARLVLIPPTLLANMNRYPYVNVNQPTPTGTIPNTLTQVSRILVTVSNLNNKGKTFAYLARVIGIDGAGDVALLQIDPFAAYNKCNPKIDECHPRLRWADSRKLTPGFKVYSFGDFTGDFTNTQLYDVGTQPAVHGFLGGLISNNKAIDYNGNILAELLLVDFVVYEGKYGLPFIDQFGRLVGMQTTNFSQRMVAGPSEFFMRRALKAFLCAGSVKNNHLGVVGDAIGSFYTYIKGYLGVAWRVATAATFDTVTQPANGQVDLKVSLSGQLYDGPSCKQIVGVQVLTLAGLDTVDYVVVPGTPGTDPLPDLPNSPLFGKINPGDIITHLNEYALGGERKQISPGLFTWNHLPGQIVKVTFRKFSDGYASTGTVLVTFDKYPGLLDYPYYTLVDFPDASFPILPVFPYPYVIPEFSQPF